MYLILIVTLPNIVQVIYNCLLKNASFINPLRVTIALDLVLHSFASRLLGDLNTKFTFQAYTEWMNKFMSVDNVF